MTDLTATPDVPASQLELLARTHEKEAFSLLIETIRDETVKREIRLKAAERVLDQARGKPKVAVAPPPRKAAKVVELSEETLLKLVQGGGQKKAGRSKRADKSEVIDGEFTPAAKPRPRNEYAVLEYTPPADASEEFL